MQKFLIQTCKVISISDDESRSVHWMLKCSCSFMAIMLGLKFLNHRQLVKYNLRSLEKKYRICMAVSLTGKHEVI